MEYLNKIPLLTGVVHSILMLASTLGAVGFLGLPYDIGVSITEFMHKTIFPYYFKTRIGHIFSCVAIIGLIVLFARKEIRVSTLIVGIFLNIIWIAYYELLLLN